MANESYIETYPEEIQNQLGTIPKVIIYPNTTLNNTRSGYGDIVAIIGAFPKVSTSIERYTSLRAARAGLGITKDVHDSEYILDEASGTYVKNKNYYEGAGALKRIFMEGTSYRSVSEVIVCNITTYDDEDNCDTPNKTLTFNKTSESMVPGSTDTTVSLFKTNHRDSKYKDNYYYVNRGTDEKPEYEIYYKVEYPCKYTPNNKSTATPKDVTMYLPLLENTKISALPYVTKDTLDNGDEYYVSHEVAYAIEGTDDNLLDKSATKPSFKSTAKKTTIYIGELKTSNYWDTNGNNKLDFEEEIHDKLSIALQRLKNDNFDILFIADYCNASDIKLLRKYMMDIYKVKNPSGLVLPVKTDDGTSSSSNGDDSSTTTVSSDTDNLSLIETYEEVIQSKTMDTDRVIEYCELFKDAEYMHSLFALIPDRYKLSNEKSGKLLNVIESAAHYCGFLAGLKVNKAPSQRALPNVIGLGEDLVFTKTSDLDNASDGYRMVHAGASVSRCLNRAKNEYGVVNSTLPCGFDTAHFRTTAYIVKQLALEPYLKRVSNDATLGYIQTTVDSVKEKVIEMFDNVYSIDTTVVQVTSTCVEIQIHIVYYGYIVDEVVFVSEEIFEDYEVV